MPGHRSRHIRHPPWCVERAVPATRAAGHVLLLTARCNSAERVGNVKGAVAVYCRVPVPSEPREHPRGLAGGERAGSTPGFGSELAVLVWLALGGRESTVPIARRGRVAGRLGRGHAVGQGAGAGIIAGTG